LLARSQDKLAPLVAGKSEREVMDMLAAAPVTFIIHGAHAPLVPPPISAAELEAAWLRTQLPPPGAGAGASSSSAGVGAPPPPKAPALLEPLPPSHDYELSDVPALASDDRKSVSFGDLAAATADAARQLLSLLQDLTDPLPAIEAARRAAAGGMDEA